MATLEMQPTKGFNDTTTRNITVDERVRVDATGMATGMATGTDNDALDMARMGRSQELRRNFKSLSVFGLAITTMSTWMGMLFGNVFSLINGGLAGTIWIYFVSWLCTFSLAASLAEMASIAPTSGGQYRKSESYYFFLQQTIANSTTADWVSEFAPKSKSRFLSYVVGWLAALGVRIRTHISSTDSY
jgi:amino acid permease